jgi:hypothetical protein
MFKIGSYISYNNDFDHKQTEKRPNFDPYETYKVN